MTKYEGLERPHKLDWQGLLDNILRKGTPGRAYHIELFQDIEIQEAIADRFGLAADLDPADRDYERKKYLAVQRFCGFDYVHIGLTGMSVNPHQCIAADTAGLPREGGRSFQDEHTGPIMSWEDFEKFQWPDPNAPAATQDIEWYQEHLPDDMCIIGRDVGHYAEWLAWLMGYETLCYSLYDQRDLLVALESKLREVFRDSVRRMLEFDRVKMIWGSDDMGFKTGLLVSPDDAREFFLPGHKELAAMTHEAGRAYLLHCCGNLTDIMDDLIDDVKIDAKHSFEDTIEDVCQVKGTYGQRIALLGGIDVDFLCRADEPAIRKRVRKTLDACMPGGGFALGTGNTVANYVPLDNYLAMVDEGWLYANGP